MSASTLLILNLSLAFYNAGTIWAHEIDIFRSWRLVDRGNFHRIQSAHWRKLPYWVFIPVGASLVGCALLLWHHPAGVPVALLAAALGCQVVSLVLTAAFWGRWQAKLASDERGGSSPYLARILSTHWVRTALINGCAACLLAGAITAYGG